MSKGELIYHPDDIAQYEQWQRELRRDRVIARLSVVYDVMNMQWVAKYKHGASRHSCKEIAIDNAVSNRITDTHNALVNRKIKKINRLFDIKE